MARLRAELLALGDVPPDADATQRLRAAERLLSGFAPRIVPGLLPVFATGLLSNALAACSCAASLPTPSGRPCCAGLHNPTTEMDLALWALAQEVRADPAAARTVRETPGEASVNTRAEIFLPGFRRALLTSCVITVIAGWPRSTSACLAGRKTLHILGVLANYLRLDNPELARPPVPPGGAGGRRDGRRPRPARSAQRPSPRCPGRVSPETSPSPGRPAGGPQVLRRPGTDAGQRAAPVGRGGDGAFRTSGERGGHLLSHPARDVAGPWPARTSALSSANAAPFTTGSSSAGTCRASCSPTAQSRQPEERRPRRQRRRCAGRRRRPGWCHAEA